MLRCTLRANGSACTQQLFVCCSNSLLYPYLVRPSGSSIFGSGNFMCAYASARERYLQLNQNESVDYIADTTLGRPCHLIASGSAPNSCCGCQLARDQPTSCGAGVPLVSFSLNTSLMSQSSTFTTSISPTLCESS